MNNDKKIILLVEDDDAIAETLIYAMQREGWQVQWFSVGLPALTYLEQHAVDFIVLDVGLPDCNGFDLCKQIRQQHQTPLLFLTARNEEVERIIGLEIGADDYCAKPFSPRVWHHDAEKMQVSYYGQLLSLTRYEYRLLEVLLKHPERVWSRYQLMQAAWENPDHSVERTIDTHIKSLRQKLHLINEQEVILTHRGVGYSLRKM
jgi:two-component system catabolic regulation response regulator CreB